MTIPMVEMSDSVVLCASCGCRGNHECERTEVESCALDRAGICPCCNEGRPDWRVEVREKREREAGQQMLFGGKR